MHIIIINFFINNFVKVSSARLPITCDSWDKLGDFSEIQLFFEKRTLVSFLCVVYLMSGVNATYTSQLICRLASMQLICNPIHERANRRATPSGWPAGLHRKLIWPYKRRRSRYARFSISTISYIFTRVPADTYDLRKRAKMRRRKFILRHAIDV